ncbi:DHH family phosphoesterase [Pseudoflavonifractor sp. P01025]|uniref:DHH family phosphoesterase n=1 Tax=Flintibacter TaxID=1918454 RepID=UPI001F436A12|nr:MULTISPECIES: DHH family phosphoesterase [Eubacteriales]MCF2676376.1 DHH family phosphoesterase [Pseudoflavonifractor phocaeensis]MCI7659346.1 DHH family phosphoesterase [Flintibacter sp.]MDD7115576.1 DHH family phosphoesterase [Flintibacter sp.]
MNRKISKLLQPSVQLYFVILILFALASALFSIPLAVLEAVVVLILGLYTRTSGHKRRREITKYIENITGNVDVATKDTMVNSPLPMVIFRPESDDIIWTNDRFLRLTGDREHLFDAKLSSVVPGFDTRWLLEGKNECPDHVSFCGRRFVVYGHLVRTGDKGGGFLATTYWVDITELCETRDKYLASRPVMAVLLLDNYEDLMKNLTENERSAIYSEINARLDAWVADTHGMLRRVERDRYYYIFEEQYLARFIEKKFDILDTIRQVSNPSGIAATFSIGVGKDGGSFQELMQFANLSIEMALSRGGDQAVVRNQFTFEFYGGRSKETEKRTKVKSRVMANALSALVADSSQVFIMGHKSPDNDCMGAAAGVCAIARKKGVPAHIIREAGSPPAKVLMDKLAHLEEYQDCFLSAQEALLLADNRSLVVVVDTNRPEQVQSLDLVQSCNRVAVIDHHRRAATYIEGAALNYHEPYASSASELVTELLQYIADPTDLTRAEAEALLAGIVLDTKNFTMRTGGRTFEAAAFLRRAGADTAEVKKLFQNDLEGTIAKYAIIQNAKLYREKIAIAVVDHTVGRIVAAQAADELLNIIGIDTSFVLYPDGERVIISARSMGDTNVQVILEKLGGGGNAAAAGGQISGKSLSQVATELSHAIDQYLEG